MATSKSAPSVRIVFASGDTVGNPRSGRPLLLDGTRPNRLYFGILGHSPAQSVHRHTIVQYALFSASAIFQRHTSTSAFPARLAPRLPWNLLNWVGPAMSAVAQFNCVRIRRHSECVPASCRRHCGVIANGAPAGDFGHPSRSATKMANAFIARRRTIENRLTAAIAVAEPRV